MRYLLALLFTLTATFVAAPTQAATLQAPALPACKHEDGSAQRATCVWDARHRGNHKGRSFLAVTVKGAPDDRFVYITHKRAHHLLGR